jgi:hypothetical protein
MIEDAALKIRQPFLKKTYVTSYSTPQASVAPPPQFQKNLRNSNNANNFSSDVGIG